MKWTRRRTTKVVGGVLLVVVVLYAVFLNSVRPQMDIMYCMVTMKGLQIAFHSYHDEYGTFPPAYTVDTDGNRLHSWRTLLLPYLNEEMYEKIRLDEPWNSEYNRQFHDKPWFIWPSGNGTECCSPVVRRKLPYGKKTGQYTNFMVVEGPGLVFDGSNSTKIKELHRGTSNTILLIESTVAVPWMCPIDLPIDAVQQGTVPHGSGILGIGDHRNRRISLFCLTDGSVHVKTPETLSQDLLPKLFYKDETAIFPW